jgi:hypothetical protein
LRISIALCTCNGSEYIAEQLASIGSQTRLPDEMVICDDLSGDQTVDIIGRFSETATFPVRLSINDRRLGSADNFGKAIAGCNGDIIVLADQDDVWYPEKLQCIEETFAAHPDTAVVFSDADVVDERLASLGYRLVPSTGIRKGDLADLKDKPHKVLLKYTVTFGTTMAFRASYRKYVLPVPAGWSHDRWIVLVISALSGIEFIEKPLIMYRQHRAQQAGAPKKTFLGTLMADACDTIINPGTHKAEFRSTITAQIESYACAYHRLSLLKDQLRDPEALRLLDEKISHLKTRDYAATVNKIRRSGVVINELLARKYQNYSYGFFSAVKDLFLV